MNEPQFPIQFDVPPTIKEKDGNFLAVGLFGGRIATAWTGPAGSGYHILSPYMKPEPLTLWQRLRRWVGL